MCGVTMSKYEVESNKAVKFDDTADWVSVELDPTFGFEQVVNFDFKQLRQSLSQMESSVRLLGRERQLAHAPHDLSKKPDLRTKLRPSVVQCLRRNESRIGQGEARRTKLTVPKVDHVGEINAKHESGTGELKLSFTGRTSLLQVKELMLQNLGYGSTVEIQFLLDGGDIAALRQDCEVLIPTAGRKRFTLTVRGIELPIPAQAQVSELSVPRCFSEDAARLQDLRAKLPMLHAPETFALCAEAEHFQLSTPRSIGSIVKVTFDDLASLHSRYTDQGECISQDGDEQEWSML